MRVIALVLAVMVACSGGNDAELEKTAVATMKELNAADESFPKRITSALAELSASLMVSPDKPQKAADIVKTKILPDVDRYLATLERAVVAADAYLATKDDASSKRHLETIRKRGESFRSARERFVTLEQKARAGATADELQSAIFNIGVMMSIGK